MRPDLDALLPLADCLSPRKPKELREWVLATCARFAQMPELREMVLLHEGIFKWFHEELYPLSVFIAARYGDRDDVLCVPKRDPSGDVDAEIYEPSRTIKIEITSARDPHEHLRMEYLVRHRHVSLTGPLTVEGNKRTGHRIENEVEFVDHRASRALHLGWVKTAAEGKAGPGRYGRDYELLIAVEDWWFDPDDVDDVRVFIRRELLTLPINFAAVHIVGLTGRLFLSFPVASSLGLGTR